MKGVVLAGGEGTRLSPCTRVTNKHLLPIYDKPMIYYPLYSLINAGIKDIMIVSGKGHAGHFLELLGSGQQFGVKISYAVQEKAGGIAQALSLTEDFSDGSNVMVLLGDNIFDYNFKDVVSKFNGGAQIFLKEVEHANRFGVASIKDGRVINIEEKPQFPRSNLAVTGAYTYDKEVYSIIKTLKPSERGELEITDVNNEYIKKGILKAVILNGFWSDAGTFKSLFLASEHIVKKQRREKKSNFFH